MKLNYNFKNYNFLLLLIVIALNAVGVLIVGSAANQDEAIVSRQIMGSMAGIAACVVVSLVNYRKILKYATLIFLIGIGFLVAVLIWGAVHKGAGRWITLPVIGQIQPAEFFKIALIIYFASFFEKHGEELNRPHFFFLAVGIFLFSAALIFVEPNLSTTIIVGVIFAGMFFAAGLSFKWIGGILGVSLPLLAVFLYTFTTDLYKKIPFLEDYQKDRIAGFLDPAKIGDRALQQQNALMAIGSGGLFGKGLNNTDIGSVKAGNFLMEEDTDFIFAIVGEELGFRGCMLVFAGFLLVILLILYAGSRAKDQGGRIICVGMAVWIGFQTFTNIAVATSLFPNTGVTLPFFSRGVSSLLALYIGLGLVLNVSLQRSSYQ